MRILHTVRQILSRAVHGLGLEGVPFSFMAGPGAGTGFQTFVNKELPVAVAGDFAGANIRASVVAGSWQYVASPGGVTVGAMGWANPATNQITSYYTAPAASCFIHRESQATIINSPGIGGPIASMQVLNGQRVIGYDQGEFWGLFTAGATIGNKVYANAVTGALTAAATGNSVTGAITSLSVATTGVMTVNTISGTPLAIGQVIIAPGVPNGSYIASLGTGTGGTGTYNLANVDGTAFVVVTTQAGNYYGAQETQFALAQNVTADCDFTGSLAVPVAGVAFRRADGDCGRLRYADPGAVAVGHRRGRTPRLSQLPDPRAVDEHRGRRRARHHRHLPGEQCAGGRDLDQHVRGDAGQAGEDKLLGHVDLIRCPPSTPYSSAT